MKNDLLLLIFGVLVALTSCNQKEDLTPQQAKEIAKDLKEGDLIEIVAPAKSIEASHVNFAKKLLEERGFKVRISENCLGKHNYFSGTEEERLSDFQKAVDNEEVKAILCARGGYGAVQIVDKIGWASFLRSPKWIIGFSDVTVFHQKVASLNLQSVHATMPLNFESNSKESISTLLETITGELNPISTRYSASNKTGKAKGLMYWLTLKWLR